MLRIELASFFLGHQAAYKFTHFTEGQKGESTYVGNCSKGVQPSLWTRLYTTVAAMINK